MSLLLLLINRWTDQKLTVSKRRRWAKSTSICGGRKKLEACKENEKVKRWESEKSKWEIKKNDERHSCSPKTMSTKKSISSLSIIISAGGKCYLFLSSFVKRQKWDKNLYLVFVLLSTTLSLSFSLWRPRFSFLLSIYITIIISRHYLLPFSSFHASTGAYLHTNSFTIFFFLFSAVPKIIHIRGRHWSCVFCRWLHILHSTQHFSNC